MNILYIYVSLLYLSVRFYSFLDGVGPTHLSAWAYTSDFHWEWDGAATSWRNCHSFVWGHNPVGPLKSWVILDLKSRSRRKKGTCKGWFLFIMWRLWSSQKGLKFKKTCTQKHRGLVKKRNNVLISTQSDDSLHWIILGKLPTKQNLANS